MVFICGEDSTASKGSSSAKPLTACLNITEVKLNYFNHIYKYSVERGPKSGFHLFPHDQGLFVFCCMHQGFIHGYTARAIAVTFGRLPQQFGFAKLS